MRLALSRPSVMASSIVQNSPEKLARQLGQKLGATTRQAALLRLGPSTRVSSTMSASYAPGMLGAKMDHIYVLPGVTPARATEWFQLGQKIVRAPSPLRRRSAILQTQALPVRARVCGHGRTGGAVPPAPRHATTASAPPSVPSSSRRTRATTLATLPDAQHSTPDPLIDCSACRASPSSTRPR